MRGRILGIWVICLWSAGSISAQVTTERIRALGVDSLAGPVVVYHSPGISQPEVIELQQLAHNCIARYRDSIKDIPPVTLAVLDSATWTRLARAPYGIPHDNFFVRPNVVVVPVSAAAIFAGVVTPERANRFFRLLALDSSSTSKLEYKYGVCAMNSAPQVSTVL